MNLADKRTVVSILKKRGLWAKKRLGQNFLVCEEVLDDLIAAAEISSTDIILEIGPGLGVLTRELCKHASRVIAVEKDSRLVDLLKENTKDFDNLKIVEGDIFKFRMTDNLFKIKPSDRKFPFSNFKCKVVANIPYYLTSHLIQYFFQNWNFFQMIVLMVQQEVAERIVARPPKMEYLSVMVQCYAKAEIVKKVPRKCFFPEPKVDSAIIRLLDIGYRISTQNPKDFFRIVKAGFSQKRKTLINALSGGLRMAKTDLMSILKKANIDPSRRAETLALKEWENLAELLAKGK